MLSLLGCRADEREPGDVKDGPGDATKPAPSPVVTDPGLPVFLETAGALPYVVAVTHRQPLHAIPDGSETLPNPFEVTSIGLDTAPDVWGGGWKSNVDAVSFGWDWIPLKDAPEAPDGPWWMDRLDVAGGSGGNLGWAILFSANGDGIQAYGWGADLGDVWSVDSFTESELVHSNAELGIDTSAALELRGLDYAAFMPEVDLIPSEASSAEAPDVTVYFSVRPSAGTTAKPDAVYRTSPELVGATGAWRWSEPEVFFTAPVADPAVAQDIRALSYDRERGRLLYWLADPATGEAAGEGYYVVAEEAGGWGDPHPARGPDGDSLNLLVDPKPKGLCSTDPSYWVDGRRDPQQQREWEQDAPIEAGAPREASDK